MSNKKEKEHTEIALPAGAREEMADSQGLGAIKCHNSVFKEVAAYAATQVQGIASIGGRSTIGTMFWREKDTGIEVLTPQEDKTLGDNEVSVSVVISVYFGNNIYDVCNELQRRIKSEIEATTSYNVREVNVNVQGLKQKEEEIQAASEAPAAAGE